MSNRPDHFERMRGPAREAHEELPEGTPEFSLDQWDYLQKIFGPEQQLKEVMGAANADDVFKAQGVAKGYATVLAHIVTLVKVNR